MWLKQSIYSPVAWAHWLCSIDCCWRCRRHEKSRTQDNLQDQYFFSCQDRGRQGCRPLLPPIWALVAGIFVLVAAASLGLTALSQSSTVCSFTIAEKPVEISIEQSQVCLTFSMDSSSKPSKDCSSRTNETTRDLLNLYDDHLWAEVLDGSARDTLRHDATYTSTAVWHSRALYFPAGVLFALCGLFLLIGICPIVEVHNADIRRPCHCTRKRVSQRGTSSYLEQGGKSTAKYATTYYGSRGCGREGEIEMVSILLLVSTAESTEHRIADYRRSHGLSYFLALPGNSSWGGRSRNRC